MTDISYTADTHEVNGIMSALSDILAPRSFRTFLEGPARAYLIDRMKQRFANEGDDVSGAWAPLSDATLEIRQNLGYPPGPINVRSGQLMRYVTTQYQTREVPQGTELTIPATVNQTPALTQAQVGGKGPARPVVAMNMADSATLTTMFRTILEERLAGWR